MLIFALLNGVYPTWGWLELPLLIGVLLLFAAGIGMLLGALFVRFRDIAPIWEVVQQALFYASPILYVATMMPDKYIRYYMLNPIAAVLTQMRHAMVDPTRPVGRGGLWRGLASSDPPGHHRGYVRPRPVGLPARSPEHRREPLSRSRAVDVEILVHAGPAEETVEHLARARPSSTFVTDLGAAAAAAAGDVVVLRGGARVSLGFIERLQAAVAGGDGTIATAAAIAVEGGGDPDQVAARTLALRPRTSQLTLDCTYVTRAALELAGPLDDGFGARCSEQGLLHVIADDVLVLGGAPTVTVTRSTPSSTAISHRGRRRGSHGR